MKTQLTLDPGFENLYKTYCDDNGKELLLMIEGIHQEQLDFGLMSKDYFTKKLPDVSIDQNANANENLSANNYMAEISKGQFKLNGVNLIWKYAQRRFSTIRANQLVRAMWDGDVYFHDSSGPQIQMPYCWAFSTTVLILEGRPYGQLHSVPPKRADSFVAQVIETTMDLSQEFAGAISPADLIVNYSWFAKREKLSDKVILNDLQKFVHVINNQFRVGAQSPSMAA